MAKKTPPPFDTRPPFERKPDNLGNIRNHLIRQRFYQLYEVEGLRYDRVIDKLMYEEFFLAAFTIERIIKYQGHYANDLVFEPKRE